MRRVDLPSDPPLTPLQIVQTLRWLGELKSSELVAAIQAAADQDVADIWPELSAAEAEELRRRARTMTGSRLRSWKSTDAEKGIGRPCWLDVRALIMGLHAIL